MIVHGDTATPFGIQRWTEQGSGPSVLLLHGVYAGAGHHEWDALVPLLSSPCCVRNADRSTQAEQPDAVAEVILGVAGVSSAQ